MTVCSLVLHLVPCTTGDHPATDYFGSCMYSTCWMQSKNIRFYLNSLPHITCFVQGQVHGICTADSASPCKAAGVLLCLGHEVGGIHAWPIVHHWSRGGCSVTTACYSGVPAVRLDPSVCRCRSSTSGRSWSSLCPVPQLWEVVFLWVLKGP